MPDKHDALRFVEETLDWSSRPLRQFADLHEEIVSNRDMTTPGAAGASRQTYPYAPPQSLRPSTPFLRDPESHASWLIATSNLFVRTVGDAEFARAVGGRGEEDAAATWDRTIRYTFDLPGHSNTLFNVMGDTVAFGIGWLEDPVVDIHEMTLGETQRDVGGASPLAAGARVRDFSPRGFSRKEIQWRHIHVLDFHPDWSAAPHFGKGMKFGVKKGRMAAKDFKAFVEGMDGHNTKALERALSKNNKEWHFDDKTGQRWRDLAIRKLTEADINLPESYRPIEYWHFGGEVPWAPVDSFKRFQSIIVANGEVVFEGPHPYYPHLWRCIKMPSASGRLIPMGILEIMRYEQDELDTWRTIRTRAGIKTVNAPTIVDSSVNWEDISQFSQPASDQVIVGRSANVPGGILGAAGQVRHDYGWLFAASTLIEEGRNFVRDSTGITDLIRGIAAGGRTTKREIEELSAQGNIPMNMRVLMVETEDLPPIAQDCGQRMILALRDLRDADQELKARLSHPAASLSHLARNLAIKFQGSTKYNARASFGGMVQEVTALLAAQPMIAPFINTVQLVADLLTINSPEAKERYLNDPNTAIGQALAGQALAGAGPVRGVASPPRPGGGVQ